MELVKAVDEDRGLKEVVLRVDNVLKEAKAIVVKDDVSYTKALEFKKVIKLAGKAVDEYFDPSIRAQRTALDELRKAKEKQSLPLEEAETIIKNVTTEYWKQKQAEAERIRQEQEKKRIEEERARQKEIKEAKKAGVEPPPPKPVEVRPVVNVEPAKVKGVSYADNWKFEVVDAEKVNSIFKVPDLKAIGRMVDSMHEKAVDVVGGIRVWNDPVQRQRTN